MKQFSSRTERTLDSGIPELEAKCIYPTWIQKQVTKIMVVMY